MKLPTMLPRDLRAFIALLASIGGSIALTGLAAVLVLILWRGGWVIATETSRIDLLGKAMLLSLMGSLVVLTSLGLAINRRTVKFGKDGFEASGGDDAAPTSVVTTTTTATETKP